MKNKGWAMPAAMLGGILYALSTASAAAEASGTLQKNGPVVISSRISGELISLSARVGQTVAAGEVLARLDAGVQKARLDEAAAQATDTKKQLERTQILYDRGLIADRDLEIAQRNHAESMARLRQAQALMSYTEIRAPFSGRISHRYVRTGETVVAQLHAPRLFSMVPDGRSLRLEVMVPAKLSYQVGDPARVRTQGGMLPATVVQVQPLATQANQQLLILQVKTRGSHHARPGTRAELLLSPASKASAAAASVSPGASSAAQE